MEVYRRSSGLLLLLGLSLLATTLQGVQGEVESEGPSESECRPYIEKALKELEAGEGAVISSAEEGDSKEDIPTVEITTDDSTHQEGDGEKDDTNEDESKENDKIVSEKIEPEVRPTVIQKIASFFQKVFQRTPSKKEEAANENKQSEYKQEDSSQEQTIQAAVDETASREEDTDGDSKEAEDGDSREDDSKKDDNESVEAQAEDKNDDSTENEDIAAEDEGSNEQSEQNRDDDVDSKEDFEQQQATEEQKDDEPNDDSKENEAQQAEPESDKSEEHGDSLEERIEAEIIEHLTQAQIQQQEDDSTENDQAQVAEDQKESVEEPDQSDEDPVQSEENTAQIGEKKGESKEEIEETKDENTAEDKSDKYQTDVSQEDVTDDSKEVKKDDSEEDKKGESKESQKVDSKEDQKVDTEEDDDGSKEDQVKSTDDSKEDQQDGDNSKEDVQDRHKRSIDDGIDSNEENSKEEATYAKSNENIADSKEDDKSEEQVKEDSKEEVKDDSKVNSVEEANDNDKKNSKDESGENKKESKEQKDASNETESDEDNKSEENTDGGPVEELSLDTEIPTNLRPRDHVEQLLKVDDESSESEKIINRVSDITLRDLKKLYENAIKPLEVLYKYRDLSNRHFGDSEIFSKPLILFMGPWSGGKSSIINYLTNNEFNDTSLRTGAEPSPAYFNILMYGEDPEIIEGSELAADFTFSGLQKFGQGLEERLRGVRLPSKLLEKVNIVEIPGILEVRKQVSRVFPFNDACQWFIDRGDIIFLVYDPSKLDVGPETEAILDQLKGREHQTRIILNKADQVKPEELMRVQGALIWNISPLMSSPQPPIMYTTSLWSRPYEPWAPVRLLQAQERAFLRDLRGAIDKRIENKIASARRFAVRVRNHAKMVDCYLTTYYNHKSVFGNRKQVADAIIEHPQDYHIYEGLSTLTNISRYDLPDPDVYKYFFKLNPLYEFQQLSATCTYFRGCPINRLDIAIAYDLPELLGTHRKRVENALAEAASGPKHQTSAPGS